MPATCTNSSLLWSIQTMPRLVHVITARNSIYLLVRERECFNTTKPSVLLLGRFLAFDYIKQRFRHMHASLIALCMRYVSPLLDESQSAYLILEQCEHFSYIIVNAYPTFHFIDASRIHLRRELVYTYSCFCVCSWSNDGYARVSRVYRTLWHTRFAPMDRFSPCPLVCVY